MTNPNDQPARCLPATEARVALDRLHDHQTDHFKQYRDRDRDPGAAGALILSEFFERAADLAAQEGAVWSTLVVPDHDGHPEEVRAALSLLAWASGYLGSTLSERAVEMRHQSAAAARGAEVMQRHEDLERGTAVRFSTSGP